MPKTTMFTARLASFVGLLALGLVATGTVVAQSSGNSNTTLSNSTSRTETFRDVELAPLRVDLYETRLLGLLQGDPTRYYDQSFDYAFGSAEVKAGLTAAMMALTAANSGNPLSFLAPTRDSSTQSPLGSETVTTSGEPRFVEPLQLGLGETIGPGTVLTGYLGTCERLQSRTYDFPYGGGFTSVSNYPFGCTGGTAEPFTVVPGTVNLITNINSLFEITRTTQTTDTYQTVDTWRLIGVPQTVSVPEPGTLSLLALGLGALLLGLRRSRAGSRTPT